MVRYFAGDERRKFKRAGVSCIVTYKVNYPLSTRLLVKDQMVDALTLDLSEGGIAVSTSFQIPPDTQVNISFVLLNESAACAQDRLRTLQVSGHVTSCVMVAKKEYRLGMAFGVISADERIFIADFVKAHLQQGTGERM